MGKKTYIIFEETGEYGGKGFNVYTEGLSPGVDKLTSEEQVNKLSPADFWGLRMFQIVTGLMREAGVIQQVKPK
jgi:hypothetical protein